MDYATIHMLITGWPPGLMIRANMKPITAAPINTQVQTDFHQGSFFILLYHSETPPALDQPLLSLELGALPCGGKPCNLSRLQLDRP